MKPSLFLALAATWTSACSLAYDEPRPTPKNDCSVDTACGGDATCAGTLRGDQICAATSSQLGDVILEVEVTSYGVGSTYVFHDSLSFNEADASGLVKNVQLDLPGSVEFTGKMVIGEPNECTASDGSVPVKALFHNRSDEGFFGYDLSSEATIDVTEGRSTAEFSVEMPPGSYDVYLQPQPTGIDGCTPFPPRLVRGVLVDADHRELLPDETTEMRTLKGVLNVPSSAEGWVLEIIDPTYGHVISDAFELGAQEGEVPIGGSGLRYYPIDGRILRLRDREGDLAVHWDLATLDLDGNDEVSIDLSDLLAMPTDVHATVLDPQGKIVPSAAVTIQSTALTGSANQNAIYRATATTDLSGVLTVKLVPGKYIVSALPQGPGAAPDFEEWEITEGGGGSGKGFVLGLQPSIQGNVVSPTGIGIPSAPLSVGPSTTVLPDYFAQVFSKPNKDDLASRPVRQQIGSTDADGDFELGVDPGKVDLVVNMAAESGYPWFVLPGFLVDQADKTPIVDVSTLQLSYPVVAQGLVTGELGPAPYAVVRAWVQPEEGGPLVQIGSTTADAYGVFVLPLPPSITELPQTQAPTDQGQTP